MATTQRITVELGRMATLYRQQTSADELRVLIEAWTELCRDMSDEDFIAACKTHLRESRFFPCPADILQAHEDALPRYAPQVELPAHTSNPAERHRCAVNAAMCRLSLRNPKAKEFFSLPDWDAKEAFARQWLGNGYPEAKTKIHRREPRRLGDYLEHMEVRQ